MAVEIFRQHWDQNKIDLLEEFKVMLLDYKQRLIGVIDLHIGNRTMVITEPQLIYAAAFVANASSIMLAHNHPSGEVQPSGPDRLITSMVNQFGIVFSLPMLDHLIITKSSYYSFKDSGSFEIRRGY